MHSEALRKARAYALTQGLCGDIGPFRHLCTRWSGHPGKHQGVLQETADDSRVFATWGDG